MSSAKHTRDHDLIRRWAEARGGVPSIVEETGGLLRIDFVEGAKSGGHDERLEETSWERFFEIFDDRGLYFLYEPDEKSRFNKFVYEDSIEEREG